MAQSRAELLEAKRATEERLRAEAAELLEANRATEERLRAEAAEFLEAKRDAEEKLRAVEAAEKIRRLEEELDRERGGRANRETVFDPTRVMRLVPTFSDADLDAYFHHFEKVATTCKWPKDQWTLLLQSVFKGKAQEAYAAVSLEQSSDYDHVKEVILQAYELVPEAYRQRFRESRRSSGQTYSEWGRQLTTKFLRWTASRKVATVEDLQQLILMEAIKDAVPVEIRTHLTEQDLVTVEAACTSADNFSLTHKVSNEKPSRVTSHSTGGGNQSGNGNQGTPSSSPPGHRRGSGRRSFGKNHERSRSVSENTSDGRNCKYCNSTGHASEDCWKQFPEKRPSSPVKKALLTTHTS
jgi:hypothetical protein